MNQEDVKEQDPNDSVITNSILKFVVEATFKPTVVEVS